MRTKVEILEEIKRMKKLQDEKTKEVIKAVNDWVNSPYGSSVEKLLKAKQNCLRNEVVEIAVRKGTLAWVLGNEYEPEEEDDPYVTDLIIEYVRKFKP